MKYKRLKISAPLLFAIFSDGLHPAFRVVADPIPADAKLVHVRHGWPNIIEILMSSETFPEIKPGEEIPDLIPTLRTEQ